MLTQIIISNNCNIPRAEFIAVVSGDHVFTKNETMQEWVKSGESAESWSRSFSKVNVSDTDYLDLKYLLDDYVSYVTDPPEVIGKKYYCKEPLTESPLYQSLLLTGEVTVTLEELLPYIVERK